MAYESTRTGNREVSRRDQRTDLGLASTCTNHPLADGDPAWNAAGDKIVFTSQRDGHTDIWVMSGGGGVIGNMTPGALTGLAPAWSPDDTEIAYIYNHDLWVLAADGSGTTRNISNSPDVQESEPTWSPDETPLITVRHRSPQATDILDGSAGRFQPHEHHPNPTTGGRRAQAELHGGTEPRSSMSVSVTSGRCRPDGTGQANLTDDFSGRSPRPKRIS